MQERTGRDMALYHVTTLFPFLEHMFSAVRGAAAYSLVPESCCS
jgi:hypothetical protein